jgi:hypothetical protein
MLPLIFFGTTCKDAISRAKLQVRYLYTTHGPSSHKSVSIYGLFIDRSYLSYHTKEYMIDMVTYNGQVPSLSTSWAQVDLLYLKVVRPLC